MAEMLRITEFWKIADILLHKLIAAWVAVGPFFKMQTCLRRACFIFSAFLVIIRLVGNPDNFELFYGPIKS